MFKMFTIIRNHWFIYFEIIDYLKNLLSILNIFKIEKSFAKLLIYSASFVYVVLCTLGGKGNFFLHNSSTSAIKSIWGQNYKIIESFLIFFFQLDCFYYPIFQFLTKIHSHLFSSDFHQICLNNSLPPLFDHCLKLSKINKY